MFWPFIQAFGLVESATRLEKLEDYPSAFKLYQQGIQLFRTVSPLIPDAKRRQLVESQCAELERRANGVRKKQLEKASRDGLSGGRGDALGLVGKAGVSAGTAISCLSMARTLNRVFSLCFIIRTRPNGSAEPSLWDAVHSIHSTASGRSNSTSLVSSAACSSAFSGP